MTTPVKSSGGNGKGDPLIRVVCPNCEGKKKIKGEKCERCGGMGAVLKDPEPSNVVQLPQNKRIIPRDVAKAVQKKFRQWKQTFIHMINRECQIEWQRAADGTFGYRFILSPELCKIVYEVQINERIRAQMDHAQKICKEKGVVMPTTQEIERIAFANLAQEFMAFTMQTMKKLQQPAGDAEKKPKEEEVTPADDGLSEEDAAEKIRQLRAQLVKGAQKVDEAGDKIKAELDRRTQGESESEKDN